jgi:putrescine aminotransferase
VRDVAGPALAEMWNGLGDHPLVGETKIIGMMGSLSLAPENGSRAKFAADAGTAGFMCRERCFANNLVMRHVGDRMIISPPLVITPEEIALLGKRARIAMDEAFVQMKDQGLLKAASY